MDQNNQEKEITVKPSEMAAADLPKNRAFEHEFTRGFLQSTEEIEEGYYPFVSGTGRYKMWLHAGAQIGDKGYTRTKDNFEQYLLHISNEDGSASGINMYFDADEQEESVDTLLEWLEGRTSQDLTFKKISLEGRDLYVAPLPLKNLEGFADTFGYVGYLQNTEERGGIQIIYSTECYEGEEPKCENIMKEEQAEMVRWMSQIEFISKNNKGDGET